MTAVVDCPGCPSTEVPSDQDRRRALIAFLAVFGILMFLCFTVLAIQRARGPCHDTKPLPSAVVNVEGDIELQPVSTSANSAAGRDTRLQSTLSSNLYVPPNDNQLPNLGLGLRNQAQYSLSQAGETASVTLEELSRLFRNATGKVSDQPHLLATDEGSKVSESNTASAHEESVEESIVVGNVKARYPVFSHVARDGIIPSPAQVAQHRRLSHHTL
jgi:hypothetical protein